MFVEIILIENAARAEALSDALVEAGALSAAIEDADADSPDEQPLFGEPGMEPAGAWQRSRIVALFDADAAIGDVVASACTSIGLPANPAFERREVADADWVRLTQAQFEPIPIADGKLWIVPSWSALPPGSEDAVLLRLDPGVAFGTGDHATTRLCLEWLVTHLTGGESVIDYGCGSGILAIAAKKLGAGTVVGTDIDEQAVLAARANATDNGADVAFADAHAFAAPRSDVVVANILSNPLKVLAPLLVSLVAPGGVLVLSGVLERQWQEVAAVYAPAVVLAPWKTADGWVCLVGHPVEAQGR
jgi:ribosomal protein L11 methyltransferase